MVRGGDDTLALSNNARSLWMGTASLLWAARLNSVDTAERVAQGGDNADAEAVQAQGFLEVAAKLYGFNGATMDRLRSGGDNADAIATATLGRLFAMTRGSLFNNATWDRARSGSAANLATLLSLGAALSVRPGEWSVNHVPAAATLATISRAAGAAGVRHVCTSIDAALVLPAAANQAAITLNLRDGATGAGTILWSRRFGIGAANAAEGAGGHVQDAQILHPAGFCRKCRFLASTMWERQQPQ